MRISFTIIFLCLIPVVIVTVAALLSANQQLIETATEVADHVLAQKLSAEIRVFRDDVQRTYGLLQRQPEPMISEYLKTPEKIIKMPCPMIIKTVLQDNRKISSCKSLNIRNVIKDITAEENAIC